MTMIAPLALLPNSVREGQVFPGNELEDYESFDFTAYRDFFLNGYKTENVLVSGGEDHAL